jgi:hypothetical protein
MRCYALRALQKTKSRELARDLEEGERCPGHKIGNYDRNERAKENS